MEQLVAVIHANFSRQHPAASFLPYRDGIEKLTAEVRVAPDPFEVFRSVITAVSVAVAVPMKAFQEFFGVFPAAARMVVVEHDPRLSVIACEVDPHV